MKNSNFAKRLNLALDKQGFPPKNRGRIQLLAEMVGLTHRGASKWINGETCPPAKKYADLAQKLNVRESWLKHGDGEMIEEKKSSIPNYSHVHNEVPVYQTADFFSQAAKPLQVVNCELPKIGKLFAIQLDTEAMSPRFPKNSIIVFDDTKEPKDGDFVLVSYDSYPAPIFRQLFIVGSMQYLNAHNPKFDRLLMSDTDKIHGTMVQAIISFI